MSYISHQPTDMGPSQGLHYLQCLSALRSFTTLSVMCWGKNVEEALFIYLQIHISLSLEEYGSLLSSKLECAFFPFIYIYMCVLNIKLIDSHIL